MYVDLTFLLIMYLFSVAGVAIGLYAVWEITELKNQRKREQITKRLNSVVASVKDKPKHTWPPV